MSAQILEFHLPTTPLSRMLARRDAIRRAIILAAQRANLAPEQIGAVVMTGLEAWTNGVSTSMSIGAGLDHVNRLKLAAPAKDPHA